MQPLSAHGSTVTFASAPIGGLTSIGLPDENKEELETTSHDSAGVREFVSGLRDSGTVALGMRLIPGDPGQDALRDNYNTVGNTLEEVVITSPADSDGESVTWTFQAYVSQRGGSLPFDQVAERSYTLRISGSITEDIVSS